MIVTLLILGTTKRLPTFARETGLVLLYVVVVGLGLAFSPLSRWALGGWSLGCWSLGCWPLRGPAFRGERVVILTLTICARAFFGTDIATGLLHNLCATLRFVCLIVIYPLPLRQ